jgi:hypothetical protein
MFGTIILFVLLTPGILLPRTFYGLPRMAVAAVYGLVLAYLLENYYSIPVLNMLEPFQGPAKKADGVICMKNVDCTSDFCGTKAGKKICMPKAKK